MDKFPIDRDSPIKGRGAVSNAGGRFEAQQCEAFDDGWDLPRDETLNPYRGCEHGCIYCFARPTHAYLGLSPGLDFETRLFSKPDAAALLETALRKPGYRPATLALGVNTDAYQPLERRLGITRSVLEVLQRFRHPLAIVTKSALVERDIDILREMAADHLVSVHLSVTTLDGELARRLEPRAAAPHRRLRTIDRLAAAGIPVSVLAAPVIPVLTDPELEAILEAASDAGAQSASYILLRLPLEVSPLFQQWLEAHYPLKAGHVMTRVRDTRGGKDYDSRFGIRLRGSGAFAEIIAQRFALACRKLKLQPRDYDLDRSAFRVPAGSGDQLDLF